MEKAIVTIFNSPQLNEVGAKLIELYKGFHSELGIAKEHAGKAIVRRFLSGELLSTYHDQIIEECGSQRAYGERIGVSESMLSNDKRAYEALSAKGIHSPEDMLNHLRQNNIKAGTYEWERLPKFLDNPNEYEEDRRGKAERRLEGISDELDTIRKNAESANHNHITRVAGEMLDEIGTLQDHLNKLDPYSYDWRSRNYINWTKSLGWDFITDEPCENLEFHHTGMNNESGGTGTKLPDIFGLPTSIQNHRKIESGSFRPTPTQLASGLIKLMSLFILNHIPSDKQ